MEKWFWIELIGFDNQKSDFATGEFLSRLPQKPDGVSLLISSVDFVNLHDAKTYRERELSPMCCSYEAHPCNEERARQKWTGKQLKGLVHTLRSYDVRVFLSFFNLFCYPDDEGNEIVEPFCAAHPELWEHRRDGSLNRSLHMLKRFPDGRYYQDFLAEKLVEVLCDYGFDGVQLADGISSARLTVQNGDYSDDMIGQYLRKGDLPENILRAGEQERADFIFRERLPEWLAFLSERWGEFYDVMLRAVKGAGKAVIFNSCWTREPFEAYYRYGLDYRKIDLSLADGCMVEEVSACMSVYGEADQGGFANSLADRAKWHYEFWAMQLLLKKCMPDLPLFDLSSLKDTNEQWDVLRDAPTEYARAVYRNSSLAIWNRGAFVPTLSGAFFCLSDGIGRTEWDKIFTLWKRAELGEDFAPLGCLCVCETAALEKELGYFLKTRNYPAHKMLSELLFYGAPIAGAAQPREARSFGGPLLLLYPEFCSDTDRNALLFRTDAPVFTLGGALIKSREADFVYRHRGERGESVFAAYNTGRKKQGTLFAPAKRAISPDSAEERQGALWTKMLTFARYDDRFFRRVCQALSAACKLPYAASEKSRVTVAIVKTAKGKYRVYADNRAYFYALPRIECRRQIVSARSVTKYGGFRIPVRVSQMTLRIPNRGIEVVETEFS